MGQLGGSFVRRLILHIGLAAAMVWMLYGGISGLAGTANAHASDGALKIVINVPAHRLYLYKNKQLVETYPVAVGKPATKSPRGEYYITQKAIWGDGFGTRWMRISVPWGIYGIHGTNKPWSVGTVASHGCFRMLNKNVEQLYSMVSVGTPVIIEGPTPFTAIRRPLEPGNIGQDVVELQRLLRLARVYQGTLSGVYSADVEKAVAKFQTMATLPSTGAATLETVKKLQEYTHQAGLKPGYLYEPPENKAPSAAQ